MLSMTPDIRSKKKVWIRAGFICICLLLLRSFLIYAGAYLNSAHGNSGYGVCKSDTASLGYVRGNCAHCHEQHASIGGNEPNPVSGYPAPYALFSENFVSQTEGFCFDCHKGVGSLQVSFERRNYNYSYWFGGDTIHHTVPDNIYDTFNLTYGSDHHSHNLEDILNFIRQRWPETFGDESNPCNACHNPHISQRGYPVVRPTDRENIWGDEADETMQYYAFQHGGKYQAPLRFDSGYEPDGSATTDGSNVPDYVTLCSDCHNATNDIWSSALGRYLKKIDWSNQSRSCIGYQAGDYHGSITRCFGRDGNVDQGCGCSEPNCSNWGYLKEPYYTANQTNFILNCTDCHEPHGSGRCYFLRTTINGHYNDVPSGPGPWSWQMEFCRSCHIHNTHCGGFGSCFNCHYHSAYARCWACTWCVEPGAPVCVHGHSF